VTGKKVDKVKKTGLTMIPSKEIAAPSIENSPLSLECKVCDVYSYGSHDMFVADVVAVSVNEELLDEKGKLRLDRSNLLVFAHGEYFTLGKKLGPIGISVKDKKKGKKAKVKPHPKG
jgi:flavin reductase (DIM6/NTAB) family NADH-FMN oxidoreductase RutF